jgi:hypothetical protein
MPELAPVTIATLPWNCKQRKREKEVRWRLQFPLAHVHRVSTCSKLQSLDRGDVDDCFELLYIGVEVDNPNRALEHY